MTLRDQYGEIDVPFAEEFSYKDAVLSVVCPAAEPINGQPVIWCRLRKGFLELNGLRFECTENFRRPVLPFTRELVAHQVRLSRGRIPEPATEQPEQPASKKARRRHQNEPAAGPILFD